MTDRIVTMEESTLRDILEWTAPENLDAIQARAKEISKDEEGDIWRAYSHGMLLGRLDNIHAAAKAALSVIERGTHE